MRPVKSYIRTILNESLLDDDDVFYNPENDKKEIEKWIRNNYNIVGKLTISDDFVVDCGDTVKVKNKTITSLTNGLFRWGRIGRRFYCSHCAIVSLEGGPKEVMNSFDCSDCRNLKSLEGAPKAVGIHFWCNACEELETLEGAPKKVAGYFNCSYCGGLTSLKGAPEKVGGCLYCKRCKNLKIADSERKKYKIRDLM